MVALNDGTKLFVTNAHTADTLLAVRSSDVGDRHGTACSWCQVTAWRRYRQTIAADRH
jgi:hypothetical protein